VQEVEDEDKRNSK